MDTMVIDGVVHIWDIFENAWVTEAYWEFVNGRSRVDPEIRTLFQGRLKT